MAPSMEAVIDFVVETTRASSSKAEVGAGEESEGTIPSQVHRRTWGVQRVFLPCQTGVQRRVPG